jgi:hypothetical protein
LSFNLALICCFRYENYSTRRKNLLKTLLLAALVAKPCVSIEETDTAYREKMLSQRKERAGKRAMEVEKRVKQKSLITQEN